MIKHILIVFATLSLSGFADASCLNEQELKETDAQYEKALLNDDYVFLKTLLHPDFTWVHNHAKHVQNSRAELLEPMIKRKAEGKVSHSVARIQDNVKVLQVNSTAVIHGFTEVERKNSPVDENGNVVRDRYNFMRTYYEHKGQCFLLANHTMLIPVDER